MASAEQFLQLLEEKDLVSAQVLDAARREIQRTSPPPDAVGLSLWLVQGQHITASQAERLLSAVLQKADDKHSIGRWQKGEPKPTEALKSSIPTPPAAKRSESAKQPTHDAPPAKKPQQPPTSSSSTSDDLELEPEPERASKAIKNPAKPAAPAAAAPVAKKQPSAPATPAAAQANRTKPPVAAPVPAVPVAAVPAAAVPVAAVPVTPAKPADIGDKLESLESKQGPLDSLIEGESLESGQFDDPTSGPALNAPISKKFSLRRSIRNLFRRNKSKTVQVKAADPRYVKVMLFSWGVAVFAILAVLTAFWYFSAADPTEIRHKAEDASSKGDYDHAIGYYDEFLKSYGDTRDADEIRGLRILAELRRANQRADKSGDWAAAVEVAQTQMKALPKSPSPDLLPKAGIAMAQIGEGIARQTQAKPDVATVKLLRAIVNLVETNVPGPVRPAEMLEGIGRVLKQSGQKVEGRQEIDQAVGEIGKAVAADDLPRAYVAYRSVVQAYPDFVDSADLAAAMKQVSAKQQQAVKEGKQTLAVSREERPSDLIAAMPLAVQGVRGDLPAGKGKLRFVVEQGTAFGLDAGSGKVLWRRFVAREVQPASKPVANSAKALEVTALPVAGASGGGVVLCDPFHQELLRVNGLTGALIWRLNVGQPIVAAPVSAGKSLLLLTKDQRLYFINAESGEVSHYLQFPQPIKLPPVADAAHGLIYVVADQSNLYAIADGRCRQVLHLGHEPGMIAAPPAAVGDSLLVAVNESPEEASLRVVSITAASKDEPLQTVGRFIIKGNVDTAPVAMGNAAAIVTTQGGLIVLAPSDAGGKTTFHVTARLDSSSDEKQEHFALFDGKSLWVTDRQLTGYAVQPAEGQIVAQTTLEQGSKFIASPTIEGGTMFCAVERPAMPGVMCSAIDLATRDPVWQSRLAAPLAAAPAVGSITGKLTVVTASGGMFRLPPAELRAGARPAEPIVAVDASRLSKPLCSLLALSDERFAISSGSGTTPIAIYDPQEQERQFRWLVSPHELAAAPAAFGSGVMAACANGEVSLLDPLAREDKLAKSFVISLPGVTEWKWQIPQATNDTASEGNLAVLCDGDHRVITLHVTGVVRALTEAASATSKSALVSPIAVLGKSVYVVDSDDKLATFNLPDLSPGKLQALGGHAVWGPQAIGNLVLVATDKDKLIAVDSHQQLLWQADLPNGPLAGPPYRSGDDIYLASQSGIVSRIGANNGKERGKSDAGCPLGSGPLVIGSRLIVGGSDGSLLEVKKP